MLLHTRFRASSPWRPLPLLCRASLPKNFASNYTQWLHTIAFQPGTTNVNNFRAAPPFLSRQARTASTSTSATESHRLDLLAIDKKWQERWARIGEIEAKQRELQHPKSLESTGTTQSRPHSYILAMFPYPSGTLHMGHLRVYTISDVLARFYRMRGHEVIHPMGWDAFGLPAENAAIERGVEPAEWTKENIKKMKSQLRSIGAQFDWEREVTTCSPDFYKHTQRIFLMLYEQGLAYRAEALVNYDPVDKTVLANEQVDAQGFSWRSGAKVEQIKLKQWFFRITAFKESLLKDLDALAGGWPERVLSQQRHWIGKSTGATIKFELSARDSETGGVDVEVFTTRPDTLYGVEYLALSIDHSVVVDAAKTDPALQKFLDSAISLPPDSKVGYKLPNITATHPLSLVDKESQTLSRKLPVFVAPYVVSGYGEGAVMGVPGHDARDLAFFKENIKPEFITMVIQPDPTPKDESASLVPVEDVKAFTHEGFLTAACWKYQGLRSNEAARQIIQDLRRIGRGDEAESWRLRDWLISRQRYWGTPIPIIHCDGCGPVPVPVNQLPVTLPKIGGEWLKGKKGNPLESATEWLHTKCPSCGGAAKRDTDTMDTFVDSSWYYLRYLDPHNEDLPFSSALVRPVDTYVGGVEHAILHLLYARFIYKFLSKSSLFPEITRSAEQPVTSVSEPFRKLLSQGMVHGKTYSEPSTGRFLLPSELDLTNPDKPLIKGTQVTPNVSFEKMSKSKHNGVDPTNCVLKYGADATRAHVLFSAPAGEVLEWDESKIVGIERSFNRLWRVVMDAKQRLLKENFQIDADRVHLAHSFRLPPLPQLADTDAEAVLATHRTISSITDCVEYNPYGLNTVISDLTKLTNTLASSSPTSSTVLYICVSSLLRLLAPVAPALSSECWEILHADLLATKGKQYDKSNNAAYSLPWSWPTPLLTDSEALTLSSRGGQTVAVQINGKLRFSVTIPRMLSASTTTASSSQDSKVTPQDEEEQNWILSRILETREGQIWLRQKNDWEKRRRVVVVKGGKVVNVVF